MTYIPQLGGTPGGDGQLVFEWNRSDISQFEGSAPTYADGASSPETSALSVVATSEQGNALRITPVGTDVTLVWLVTDPLDFEDTRRDVLLEIEIFDHADLTNRFGGICCLANDAADHALLHLPAAFDGERAAIINNGTTVLSAIGGSASGRGGFYYFHIRGDKPAGSPPQLTSRFNGGISGAPRRNPRRTGTDATARGSVDDWGSDTTLGSTWDDLALDRFGLAYATSGGSGGSVMDILNLRAFLL